MTTFRERQAIGLDRNVQYIRDHPRGARLLPWVYGFGAVSGLWNAALHTVRLDWSALYWIVFTLLFGALAWRWRQARGIAEATPALRVERAPAAPLTHRQKVGTGVVGAGVLLLVSSAIAVAAGAGDSASMAVFLAGAIVCTAGYSLRR